jgi:uncharacterized cofD-like protein
LISSPKIVAFGGGHGLAATLRALRSLTKNLTAIVTVADNGGSSGRLRREFNSLPPGDLRMALAALCGDDDWGRNWAALMQYRFTSDGELNGHSVGNLLLAALWDKDGDPVAGLDRVGELLKVVGRVLPMSREPLDIEGRFRTWEGTQVIRGQKEVALGRGVLEELNLIPAGAAPTSEGLSAIADADFLTLGPGSWFTSVLPHLLLEQQREAICKSSARRILILNLESDSTTEEMAGVGPAEHLRMLRNFAPEFTCNFALADTSLASRAEEISELRKIISEMGGELIVSDLAISPGSNQHNSEKLAGCFREILTS